LAWLARCGPIRSIPALLTAGILLAAPGPVICLLIVEGFTHWQSALAARLYDNSVAAPWLAQTLRSLPIAILVLWYALRTVSSAVLQSAEMDGAGRAGRLLHVAAASRVPALLLAWLASLAVSMGEYSATFQTLPPGVSTVPSTLFIMLHQGVDDQIAALALVQWTVAAAVAGTATLTAARLDRNGKEPSVKS
jgi:iron(III) transport system permease protein